MTEQASASPSSAELFGSDRMWGLKELPLPEPVSWWPQTLGWYILGLLLLLALAWFGWRLWQRYRRNAYRREGLAELDDIATDPEGLRRLPYLLRKSALAAVPRSEVAALRGGDWIAWLNRSAGSELFTDSDGQMLDRLAFADAGLLALDEPHARHLLEVRQEVDEVASWSSLSSSGRLRYCHCRL